MFTSISNCFLYTTDNSVKTTTSDGNPYTDPETELV